MRSVNDRLLEESSQSHSVPKRPRRVRNSMLLLVLALATAALFVHLAWCAIVQRRQARSALRYGRSTSGPRKELPPAAVLTGSDSTTPADGPAVDPTPVGNTAGLSCGNGRKAYAPSCHPRWRQRGCRHAPRRSCTLRIRPPLGRTHGTLDFQASGRAICAASAPRRCQSGQGRPAEALYLPLPSSQ
jgi:hypothetical protein